MEIASKERIPNKQVLYGFSMTHLTSGHFHTSQKLTVSIKAQGVKGQVGIAYKPKLSECLDVCSSIKQTSR